MATALGLDWYAQGLEFKIYEPGSSSLDFVRTDLKRGENIEETLPCCLKLCVLLTDAIVHSIGRSTLDGWYFFSMGAESMGLGSPTPNELQAYGPQLVCSINLIHVG